MNALLAALLLLTPSSQADSASRLSLTDYLSQVQAKNPGVVAAGLQAEGGEARSSEGNTITAPQFFANAQWVNDESYSFSYDSAKTNTYTLGISHQATFGLSTKLSYALTSYELSNVDIGTARINAQFWDARPKVELSFPLWGGGFGRQTRASRDAINAQAAASRYGAQAIQTQQLIEAEIAYWRLAGLQQTLALQKQALARAEKLYSWSSRRASQGLSDRSDALQAESNLTLRRLELETTQSDLLAAARQFHALRGESSESLAVELDPLTTGLQAPFTLPPDPQAAARADVRAAQAQIEAAEAAATLGAEKNRPQLNLMGSYTFNGRDVTSREAMSDAFDSNRPTRMVGVSFTAPLNVFTTSSTIRGYQLERSAAERNLQKKLLDQKTTYLELKQRLNDIESRLKLARTLENTQKQKAEHEQRRLSLGRTTTFQSLTFEQDLSTAELTRLRLELELLASRAQFKAFDAAP